MLGISIISLLASYRSNLSACTKPSSRTSTLASIFIDQDQTAAEFAGRSAPYNPERWTMVGMRAETLHEGPRAFAETGAIRQVAWRCREASSFP